MRAIILDSETANLELLLEHRRRTGIDRLDEVWEGVLHLVPAPSMPHALILQQLAELLGPLARERGLTPVMHEVKIGASDQNYRIPDGSLHRDPSLGAWHLTAALVVEVVSATGDESWEKLPFYAAHHVDEVLIADPQERSVDWLALNDRTEYEPTDRSALIELGPAELRELIEWPGA
jgi:hypothetical protein